MPWIQLLVSCLLVMSVHSQIGSKTEFSWGNGRCSTLPKVQGICETGYAYAAAAAIAIAKCIVNPSDILTVDLSAQQIIDCSTNYGNHGCQGGSAVNAFKYVNASKGLNLDFWYNIERDVLNNSNLCSEVLLDAVKIDGFSRYEDVSEKFLMDLIASKGPVVVGIDASLDSFKTWYGIGVYNDPNCKSGPSHLNHEVLLIGFGNEAITGFPYWEFINSYGSLWGSAGRMRIARANNLCGIRTRVSYPTVPKPN
jgi:cathepsin L